VKLTLRIFGVAALVCSPSLAQSTPQDHVPIYKVTVIERTTKAVNYQYRTGPTTIDFRGTVLMPQAKGEATVESLRGRTEVDAKFSNLTPPTQFGREYLTYTLWAITPDGGAHSLGEVVADGSNKAKIHVTTDLQAFGLIVTAEPYSATHLPSDVVVLENEVRPETMGRTQPIVAKYELLPRGQYTYEVPDKLRPAAPAGPKLSMDQYEAVLEVYEAQNAIGIARAASADTYATPTFQKAEGLLAAAQRLQAIKAPAGEIIQNAREAAQTAEDARSIADRRRQDERIAKAETEAANTRAAAQTSVRQAQIEADAARAQAEQERAARQRAEAEAADLRNRAADRIDTAPAAPPPPPPPAVTAPDTQRTDLRMRLYEQLNSGVLTRDTPRGLVATLSDSAFNGTALRDTGSTQVARIAAVLAAHPDLRVEVEGFTDSAATSSTAWRRAEAVQRMLQEHGLQQAQIASRGMGDGRPVASNATPDGRMQNRRVEIVISGAAIGNTPFWDHPYSLAPGSGRPN
jgi:flagellar motor protein MotB